MNMITSRKEKPVVNYFKCFTEEEPNQGLYDDLYEIGEATFNSWFFKNSIVCEVTSVNEIEPPKQILEKISKEKTYRPESGQCHYNSLMASLLHDDLEFYTGLYIKSNGDTITHSFCLFNDRIADFTAKFFLEPDEFGFNTNCFPFEYIGVKVEKSFLFPKKQDIIKDGYNTKPYLYEWYLETCKNC